MKKGSISITRLNAGTGDDRVRITIRRAGEAPASRLLLGVSFENFTRALMGQAEVEIDIFKDF